MRVRPFKSCYSAATYYHWGRMPPVSAPDSIWREWFRLREEAGELEIYRELEQA